MPTSNLKAAISVKTANQTLLALHLLQLITAPALIFLPNSQGMLIFAVGNAVLIGLLFSQSIREFLQDKRLQNPPRLKTAITLTGLYLTISFGLEFFFGILLSWFPPELSNKLLGDELPLKGISGIWNTSLLFFAVAIVIPFYEEFVFRGVILTAYEQARSLRFAAIFTAFLFALSHPGLLKLIIFIPADFILARAVQRYQSWWLAVIAHVVYNSIALNLMLVVNFEATKSKSVNFLLFASIAAIALAISAFIIAVRWLRAFSSEVPAVIEKPEKIWTPALIAVVLLTTAISISTILFPNNGQ